MVVEPLLIANAISIQIVVLDGRHCISCKAFIPPLEEEDWVPSCAVELKHKCAASRLCLDWCPHSNSVVVCSEVQAMVRSQSMQAHLTCRIARANIMKYSQIHCI